MKATKHFHPFPKLPAELKALIWEYYNTTQPVLRHCFSIQNVRESRASRSKCQRRSYAVFNEETRLYVNNKAESRDEPDMPTRIRVRLPGKVHMRNNGRSPYTATSLGEDFELNGQEVISVSRADIWVNFERDVFYFDCTQYIKYASSTFNFDRASEWFRCLYNPIDRDPPRPLDDNHWIFSVRKLALRLKEVPQQADLDILGKLTRLREVSLVAGDVPRTYFNHPQLRMHGGVYATCPNVSARRGFLPLDQLKHKSLWVQNRAMPKEVLAVLEQLFSDNQMTVKVSVVVDMY
ncbi:hypothetical protein F5Y15DRAFT_397176 [Xylariaceae sp. FL0016]|nr:hypothetical protein F5Y15DRAFT_397176 [Xylariaceae sp. FL0016]